MSPSFPGESSEEAPQSPSVSTAVEEERDFPVVGIGASAGGVDALRRFFRHLPGEEDLSSGMAFVVLHLSPDHESNLTEILQHETDLPAEVARASLTLTTREGDAVVECRRP